MNDQEQKKSNNVFAGVFNKVTTLGKKTADSLQQKTHDFSQKRKQNAIEQKIQKYNPLFAEDFKNMEFNLPNIIEIVDDAVRRDIEVCKGAVGWTDKINGVEILHLYDEWISESKIQFLPFAQCDAVYCVDNFDRNVFINVESVFERTTNEKLSELEQIACSLGAKCCSVEISEITTKTIAIEKNASQKGLGNFEASKSSRNQNAQKGKIVSYFEGSNSPKPPKLKWFSNDESIRKLVEMRCSSNNTIKFKMLEINCSSATTMSQKSACAIDKILKGKSKFSMEKKSIKEHSSKLIFEIEF